RDPSLTLSIASRPGIFADTAALVRATTYPFATTATEPPVPPLPPVAAPLFPDAETVTTCTGIAAPRRPITRTAAMIRTAPAANQIARPSARFTAGGGSSRLIRRLGRSADGAVTPRRDDRARHAARSRYAPPRCRHA